MKQSVLTGKFIFDRLRKLHGDLKDMGEACNLVRDELGSDNASHKLLMAQFRIMKDEISRLERETFTVSQKSPFDF